MLPCWVEAPYRFGLLDLVDPPGRTEMLKAVNRSPHELDLHG